MTTNDEYLVKTEFHLHTAETSPCGMVPGRKIIKACADAGYGCVLVTDHYLPGMFDRPETRDLYLKGYREARAAGETLGVTVLPGMEFRFEDAENDFLIYGMEEEDFAGLPAGLSRYTLMDFTAYCHAHGWLVFQAHPFRSWCQVQNPAYLDGIEVYNGNPRQLSHNSEALAFAREHRLLEIAGGDVHQLGDVREQGVMVPRRFLTPRGIAEFLRSRPAVGADFAQSIRG